MKISRYSERAKSPDAISSMSSSKNIPWDVPHLLEAPTFVDAPEYNTDGTHAIFYEGLPWKGSPTRVFAYYCIPPVATGQRLPAMVLVHGGGGSAFASWVRLWASRGYAAIAMDTCGCVTGDANSNHLRHDQGGPPGWGGFDQIGDAVTDQWTYHAVADVILAHSLIRSFPEVDEARVGLTGISWGGYLTCLAASLDHRFAFAASVYGCGFLQDDGLWFEATKNLSSSDAQTWSEQWDPAQHLHRVAMPMLWLTGTNDPAFSMNALQRSYRLGPKNRTLSIHRRMPHGQREGESPEEIHIFANSFLKNGRPLTTIQNTIRNGRNVSVEFSSSRPITRCDLIFTKDRGAWGDRYWDNYPADLQGAHATAILPIGVTTYFFNLADEDGFIVSSDHVELSW